MAPTPPPALARRRPVVQPLQSRPITHSANNTPSHRTLRKLHASLDFDMPLDDDEHQPNNVHLPERRATEPASPPPPFVSNHHTVILKDEPVSPPTPDLPSQLPFDSALIKNDADPQDEDDHVTKYLARVHFTQLDDTEVFSSGDEHTNTAPPLHGRRLPTSMEDDDDGDDDDAWFGGINFTRDAAPVSPLPPASIKKGRNEKKNGQITNDVALRRANQGDAACSMCARLASENRRLRRLLDEADFAVAAADVERRSRSVSDPQSIIDATSPRTSSGGASWRSSITSRSLNRNAKQSSEKSRLRAQVRALAVTTEYLWRKLASTERELADLRAAGLCTPSSPSWNADLEDTFLAARIDRNALLDRAYNRS